MTVNKKLIIINKEKIYSKENSFYCDNVDMKSIPEELDKNFDVSVIAVQSNIERFHKINLEKIKNTSNIFMFLSNIFQTFKHKEASYLLISITPYTFFAYFLLFMFKKKVFVYLRSNGYEEYRAIFGFIGPLIYHIMYTFVTFKSNVITCQKRLVKKKKYDLVFPSELDNDWLRNKKVPLLDKPKLLYVGRIKVEKGVFSLFKMFNELNEDIDLSVVGKIENLNINNKKINFLGFEKNFLSLIKIYDRHNITILPSFTEAHPKVVDESLARERPVIIFEEISHIIQNRYGVFVSKRNVKSLLETIKFIISNYLSIQESMKKNKLPTKENFISQIKQILN